MSRDDSTLEERPQQSPRGGLSENSFQNKLSDPSYLVPCAPHDWVRTRFEIATRQKSHINVERYFRFRALFYPADQPKIVYERLGILIWHSEFLLTPLKVILYRLDRLSTRLQTKGCLGEWVIKPSGSEMRFAPMQRLHKKENNTADAIPLRHRRGIIYFFCSSSSKTPLNMRNTSSLLYINLPTTS